jgi:hypothetical protein
MAQLGVSERRFLITANNLRARLRDLLLWVNLRVSYTRNFGLRLVPDKLCLACMKPSGASERQGGFVQNGKDRLFR